jgi:RNA polymerase sigma factor (sigma-70 family)
MGPAADQDSHLLERYARSRDHAAFGVLVRQRVDLVYSAAVRRVGDRHLAEDVTQAVFVILASKPDAARSSASLGAWLLRTVRYAAANTLKVERRRRRHERAAASASSRSSSRASAGGACSANPSDVLVWQELAGHLDEAVLKLPPVDRRAIILRYFEHQPIRDVAAALDVSEAAAKQRLSRSVDKLRRLLTRRAGTITLAPAGDDGLATMLSAHAVRAAPPTLLSATSPAAISAAALGGGGAALGAGPGAASVQIAKGAITMMTWAKIKAVAACVTVAAVVGTGAVVTVNHAIAQSGARQVAAAAAPANAQAVEGGEDEERDPADDPARAFLKKESPELKFDGANLKEVVDFLMDVFTVPIFLDRPALEGAEIDPAKVSVRLTVDKGTTLERVLEVLTAEAGTEENPAAWDVAGSVIVISTPDGVKAFVRRHHAALLRGGEPGGGVLNRKLPEVTLDKVALDKVITFFEDITAAKFEVDWEALKEAGVDGESPITVRGRDLKFSQSLQLVLDSLPATKPIGFSVEPDRIVIGLAPKDPPPVKAEGL